ncbi:glycosyltransferase family 4 protein, partial [Candidatus Woesearchaeota archaeon]|nr:glycosyltransferase family 4 protein [Candidatus Woesearchaeota archaeon]
TGNNNLNQGVYDIEREGFHEADKILAVSNFTRDKVINHYGISPDKVVTCHNAVEFNDNDFHYHNDAKREKMVLFLGRITLQKGPEYFIQAAKKVLDVNPNVKFVFAGNGDMEARMINYAAELGIAHKILFAGFLRGPDVDRAYQMADLYVMPSVSEPFGLTPLESMRNGTPVLISNQSGVSEVINHCLKVDFWDVDRMANQMLSVLNYPTLKKELQHNGSQEIRKFSWRDPARVCINAYNEVRSK